jgi:prophage tail gpP-like protein
MAQQYSAQPRDPVAGEDDVTLTIGGRAMGGWTSVRVTRGIERCPNDFDIGLTNLEPRPADGIVVHPGDVCTLRFGKDLVITGYVDRVLPKITTREHSIRVLGRGKCQDLVDCAAEWKNQQITNSNLFEIAAKLAAPFGIGVQSLGDIGDVVPQYNIAHGTTAWDVIEEWCRIRKVLAFETPDGNLQLLNAGSSPVPMTGAADPFLAAASGFVEGINVQHAEAEWSMDQRYSVYRVYRQGLEMLLDVGYGENLIATYPDDAVPRYRPHDVIAEVASGQGLDNAKERGQWEASRRAGRSAAVRLTTDSWRDGAGQLYAPGTTAVLSIPSVGKQEDPRLGPPWVISQIVYRRDDQGTTAELLMMPRAAFAPPPTLPPMVLPPILLNKPPGAGRAR